MADLLLGVWVNIKVCQLRYQNLMCILHLSHCVKIDYN